MFLRWLGGRKSRHPPIPSSACQLSTHTRYGRIQRGGPPIHSGAGGGGWTVTAARRCSVRQRNTTPGTTPSHPASLPSRAIDGGVPARVPPGSTHRCQPGHPLAVRSQGISHPCVGLDWTGAASRRGRGGGGARSREHWQGRKACPLHRPHGHCVKWPGEGFGERGLVRGCAGGWIGCFGRVPSRSGSCLQTRNLQASRAPVRHQPRPPPVKPLPYPHLVLCWRGCPSPSGRYCPSRPPSGESFAPS